MAFYLRIGSDYLEQAEPHKFKSDAVHAYRLVAESFDRHGSTPPEASIHIADSKDELAEYPDFVLSFGPRGGIKVEPA